MSASVLPAPSGSTTAELEGDGRPAPSAARAFSIRRRDPCAARLR